MFFICAKVRFVSWYFYVKNGHKRENMLTHTVYVCLPTLRQSYLTFITVWLQVVDRYSPRYIPRQIPKQRNCMVTSWIVMDIARCGISSFQRLSLWQRGATWKIYGENVHLISNKYLSGISGAVWIRWCQSTKRQIHYYRGDHPRWTHFPLMTRRYGVICGNITQLFVFSLFIYLMTSIYEKEASSLQPEREC